MFNSSILPSYSYSYIGRPTAFKSFLPVRIIRLLLTKRTELCLGTIVHLRCYVSFFPIILSLFCSYVYSVQCNKLSMDILQRHEESRPTMNTLDSQHSCL